MMHPNSATPIMGSSRGFRSPVSSNQPQYGYGTGNNGMGNSSAFNMQSSHYQRHRADVRRRRHYMYFCSFMVITALYMCYSGSSSTKVATSQSQNAMKSTMMKVDQSHFNKKRLKNMKKQTSSGGGSSSTQPQQLQRQQQEEEPTVMQLVLLPAENPLPKGALSIDESALAYFLDQATGQTPAPPKPFFEKRFIKSSNTQQEAQPQMEKTYIDKWNGGSLQMEQPQQYQSNGGSQKAAQPNMGKKYIDSRNGGTLKAAEPSQEGEHPPPPPGHHFPTLDGLLPGVPTPDGEHPPPPPGHHIPLLDGLLPGVPTPDGDAPPPPSDQILDQNGVLSEAPEDGADTRDNLLGKFHIHLPEHLVEDLKEELQSKIVDPAEAWQSSFSGSSTSSNTNESEEGESGEDGEPYVDSQAKDQLLIVGTVASMALMVGAISARKLRRRVAVRQEGHYSDATSDWLSTCIENNLEDEVAYDTATTTSGAYSDIMSNAGSRPGAYDTLSQVSNGWRNDLEKFDV